MLNRYFIAPLAALALLTAPHLAQAQTATGSVGIGTTTPNAAAALEIKSTSQGLLLPRLSLAQRTALTASATAPPVPGLVIYQTDNTPGLYAYDGAAWVRLGADNLGNHTATQNLNLGANQLVGNGGTAGLTVSSAGNVGIGLGTASPTQALDVNGGILARANSTISNQGAYLQWNRTGGDGETWLLNQLGGGNANAGIRFGSVTTSNATTEWGRFLNNGNFGLGTTNPGQKLEVAGQVYSSGSTGGFRFPDGTVQTTAAAGDNLGNGTATTAVKLNGNTLSNNGTGGFSIDNSGNATLTGNSTVTGTSSVAGNSAVAGNGSVAGTLAVGSTTANAKAALDITSTTKGLLPPRLTLAQRDGMGVPPVGLLIIQTDNTPGLYQYTATGWSSVGAGNYTAESSSVNAAPTTAVTVNPGVTNMVYTSNSTATNGTVTLGTGTEGQRLVIVNNDNEYLPVVSASGTGNILPRYAARYIYTNGAWRRES